MSDLDIKYDGDFDGLGDADDDVMEIEKEMHRYD